MRWPQRPSKRWVSHTRARRRRPEAERGQGKGQRRSVSTGVPTPEDVLLNVAARRVGSIPRHREAVREHCSIGITPEAVVLDLPALRNASPSSPRPIGRRAGGGVHRRPGIPGHLWGNEDVEMLPPVEMEFSAFSDLRERLLLVGCQVHAWLRATTPRSAPSHRSADHGGAQPARTGIPDCLPGMGIRDYARFDFRLREGVFYLLDPNPTPTSAPTPAWPSWRSLPAILSARWAAGWVRLAAARHPVFGKQAKGTRQKK